MSTAALGMLALADPAFADIGSNPLAFPLIDGDHTNFLVLGSQSKRVLVDVPGIGLVETDCLPDSKSTPPGINDAYGHPVAVDASSGDLLVGEGEMQLLRSGVTARLRLGAAAEIVGTTGRMISDALAHVHARSQFGAAIASYPAIRDLLAGAATDRHQLRELLYCAWAARPLSDPDPELARTIKALAGTSGLRIARATLQVSGAIAFTAEHTHGDQHRRILTLDSIAGSSGQLTREIGAEIRHTGKLPGMVGLSQLAASIAE